MTQFLPWQSPPALVATRIVAGGPTGCTDPCGRAAHAVPASYRFGFTAFFLSGAVCTLRNLTLLVDDAAFWFGFSHAEPVEI
jgi:hypothetical protein